MDSSIVICELKDPTYARQLVALTREDSTQWTEANYLAHLRDYITYGAFIEPDRSTMGENPRVLQGFIAACLVAGDLEIVNLYVIPEARRTGIAMRLLQHTLLTHQPLNTFLEVRSSNIAALTLYKNYGFSQYGTRKKYYRDKEDAILLKLSTRNATT